MKKNDRCSFCDEIAIVKLSKILGQNLIDFNFCENHRKSFSFEKPREEAKKKRKPAFKNDSLIKELQEKIKECIKNQDYVKAAEIKELIDKAIKERDEGS
jgi:protein-arginine kinase activator protein McsA